MALKNENGSKGRCSIFQNPKGEIMIMLDCFDGTPENSLFIYDGGLKALLYRSNDSSVTLDNIDADARLPLKSVAEVLVVEIENNEVEREYIVPVRIVKNVDDFIVS